MSYGKITLHKPETYQIKVPGVLDTMWAENARLLSMEVEETDGGEPITLLIVLMDQAALHGLLRQLYTAGMPLISVNCIRFCKKTSN